MPTIRSFLAAAAVATALVSPLAAAADNRLGCVLREPGQPGRFVAASSLVDRAAVWRAVGEERTVRPLSPLVSPCRLGLRRDISAAAYSRMATRNPERFRPLDAVSDPGQAVGPSVRRAPNLGFHDISSPLTGDDRFFSAVQGWGRRGVLGAQVVFRADGSIDESVVVVTDGVSRQVGKGSPTVANASGWVGGAFVYDPVNFLFQAALFRDGQRLPVPFVPGTATSIVIGLADDGNALVVNTAEDFSSEFLTLWDGRLHRHVDLGPDVPFSFFVRMNGRGVIAGTTERNGSPVAFRHDTRTGLTTILPPVPSEPNAWGLGINSRGEVLGYSFEFGGIERIGTWDASGVFRTRIVQGTPDNPTISNDLDFNDAGVIVIGRVSRPADEVGRLYLLPPGGPRIDVAGATRGIPSDAALYGATALTDVGNLIGTAFVPSNPFGFVEFLLLRDGP